MKVVLVSNFDNESVAEKLLVKGLDKTQAEQIAREWNDSSSSEYSQHCAVVKEDCYRLWRGMADIF